MAGISSKAAGKTENKKKYNGYELNSDFDINLYESFYRLHDPQIGRFWQLDPSPTDYESLYAAMGNNPVLNFDVLGDTLQFPGATPEFQEQFNQAGTLLEANGVGDLLQKANEMPGIVKVVEGQEGEINSYDPNTKTLHWSPLTVLETDRGIKLSPAAILNHELDHAVQHATNPVKYNKENDHKKGKDKQYDTKEERRVITNSEQRTAKALGLMKDGQVTRTNHNKGKLYPTTGVASTKNRTIELIKQQQETLKREKEIQKQKKGSEN